MKQKFLLYFALLALPSCESIWDEKINGDYDEKYVWNMSQMAEGVLYNAYKAIPNRPDSYDGNFLDAATDNALTRVYSSSVYNVTSGKLSKNNNPFDNWSNCYQQLQYINSFLEKGLTDQIKYDKLDEEKDAEYKQRLEGEAYFLRAFWGFRLLQQFGGKTSTGIALGYPLVMHFVTEEEARNLSDFKRDTYQDCAKQIMDDCDKAIELLPEKYTGDDAILGAKEIGRPTKMTVAALKSRVALYKASPAFQDDSVVMLNGMGDFTVVDEDKYKAQWAEAAKIADDAIRMNGFGDVYALKATDLVGGNANSTPGEFLYRFFYQNNDMEKRHFPPYYLGGAQTIPSQNLVDAFPAKNGFPINDPRANHDKKNPYANRDNRLELNIYYHGKGFGNAAGWRPLDMSEGGIDSYSYDAFCSRSGYYLAKYMGKNQLMLDPINPGSPVHYYPVIRKTEVFLNFAEAANEAWGPRSQGPNNSSKFTAYQIIKAIRNKSGGIQNTTYLDEMAADKDKFRELIQNERRLELAFENHRYYDLRRCLLPLNEPIKGVTVIKEGEETKYEYKVIEERKFDHIRYYYLPIPYSECLKNPDFINNLGWE